MKSVTKILSRLFPMDGNIPKHILENARKRGVAVHEWIENYNNWVVDKKDVEPIIDLEYQIYADYYKDWFKDYQVEPLMSEIKLSHDGVVGVIDMLANVVENDIKKKVLVSFKITYDYDIPYCELQESAYNELLFKNKIIDEKVPARLLHISKMKYNYVELNDEWDKFKVLKELDEYIDKRRKDKK